MKEVSKSENIREKLKASKISPLKTYMGLTLGEQSLSKFILYEILTSILGPLPGGVGYFLRKNTYRWFIRSIGSNFILGRNVVIRHPHRLKIGNNVTIDDNCLIDGRGAGDTGVIIENNVVINRNCYIQAKNGYIRISNRASIGCNSVIISMDGLEIGEAVLIAGGCYISAGAYKYENPNLPIMDQVVYTNGPISIGAGVWIGTRVTLLDGVKIGKNAVIGAGAIVTKDIPEYTVAVGIPAKVIREIKV
jgi:acetyltransferase-like isoleucine patch superfamily enzyme